MCGSERELADLYPIPGLFAQAQPKSLDSIKDCAFAQRTKAYGKA